MLPVGDVQSSRGVHNEPVIRGPEGPCGHVTRSLQQMRPQLVWRLEHWRPLPGWQGVHQQD